MVEESKVQHWYGTEVTFQPITQSLLIPLIFAIYIAYGFPYQHDNRSLTRGCLFLHNLRYCNIHSNSFPFCCRLIYNQPYFPKGWSFLLFSAVFSPSAFTIRASQLRSRVDFSTSFPWPSAERWDGWDSRNDWFGGFCPGVSLRKTFALVVELCEE